MAKYAITISNECIGCRACVSIYEENFIFDEKTNKAKVKEKIIDDKKLGNNKEAEEICPVNAIKIKKC